MRFSRIFSLFFIFFFLVQQTALYSIPEQKICCIDCHGVIVAKRPWAIQKNVAKFLVRHNYKLIPLLVIVGPQLLYQKLQGIPFSIEQVLRDYPDLEQYKDELYDFLAFEEPLHDTFLVIKKLKEKGFTVILTSNLSPYSYDHNKKKTPELFDIFDFHHIATTERIKKSSPEYFVRLRAKFNELFAIDDATEILLIDDNPLYIAAAQEAQVNIHTIRFENPHHIEEELKEQGYL